LVKAPAGGGAPEFGSGECSRGSFPASQPGTVKDYLPEHVAAILDDLGRVTGAFLDKSRGKFALRERMDS